MGTIQPDFDFNLPLPRRALRKSEMSAVRADIILGSPGAACSGLGVCKMMSPVLAHVRYKCPLVSAWLSLTPERRLRVSFLKSSMDLQLQRRHFRWCLFQVLEAYELPDELTRGLPGLQDRTIRPGIYTVWETMDHLVVDF